MRDLARQLRCSRTCIANAVRRLGRQAMAAHLHLMTGFTHSGRLCFDGLISAVGSSDYASQITTLGDTKHELILAMTHCVTERGGSRTPRQRTRIIAKRSRWRPRPGALADSIALLIIELSRFASDHKLHIDVDEHPIYRVLIARDLALRWFRSAGRLAVRRTPGSAPRFPTNPLAFANYVDRMIRHRLIEHTRQSIAIARSATMQMHRMWLFAWDHNVLQPHRVAVPGSAARVVRAGVSDILVRRALRDFFSRRFCLKGLFMPESIREVWMGLANTPPLRWRTRSTPPIPSVPRYARLDLSFAHLQGQ
jgi:hypothetical protein